MKNRDEPNILRNFFRFYQTAFSLNDSSKADQQNSMIHLTGTSSEFQQNCLEKFEKKYVQLEFPAISHVMNFMKF